ncbi:PspC domain-containing protein [Aestuariimicrobium kwangyangense]|uniref:PspC domain-containing protein n=1 Tax=Aestuariimicrobium kwangyangense TaxID=396389 RepID=UPI0003B640F6|nr:PspC domain-containing protein [Aestuariimicrobium kwangyangense]
MTEQPTAELVRQPRASEGQLAGVCAALAARWRVDPLLIRTAMVVAALSGGVGLVVYGALWLWMPPADGGPAKITRWLPAWRDWSTGKVVLLIVALSVLATVVTSTITPFGIGPLVVLAVMTAVGRRHVAKLDAERHLRASVLPPRVSAVSAAPILASSGRMGPAALPTVALPRGSAVATPAPGTATATTADWPTAPLVPWGSGSSAPVTGHEPTLVLPRADASAHVRQVPGRPDTEFGGAVAAWQSRMQQVREGRVPPPLTHSEAPRPSVPLLTAQPRPVHGAGRRVHTRSVTGPRPSWWGSLITVALAVGAYAAVTRVDPGNHLVALTAALCVIGLGLMVGAFVGRPRLMVALGLVVALSLVPAGVIPGDRQGPTMQQLVWTTPAETHDLNLVGQARNLDLSHLVLTDDTTITIDAVGSVVAVSVPGTLPVTVVYNSKASAMAIDTRGDSPGSKQVIADRSIAPVQRATAGDHRETVDLGGSSGPRLTLVLNLTWSAGAVHTS